MSAVASQITSLTIVYSTFHSCADQRKQSSASLAFVQGIHRWPINSPHKCSVTRKMFPFDDVIMSLSAPKGIVVGPCVRPAARLSVPNDVTAPTLQGFQLSAWKLIGWCTVPWSISLLTMAMCGQFFLRTTKFWGIAWERAWGTTLPL